MPAARILRTSRSLSLHGSSLAVAGSQTQVGFPLREAFPDEPFRGRVSEGCNRFQSADEHDLTS